MSTITLPSRNREASQDTASHSSSSHSLDTAPDAEILSRSSVKQVLACCRRHLERFTGAARSGVYEDGESVDSSSCFELRRQRSNTFPLQPNARRTRTDRPAPLNLTYSSNASYRFYMDEDIHPFITTPSCMEESNSPKFNLSFASQSR
ncbi:hypothetical protein SVAN01_01262 [Stagonosporopsis vannaccii]|nr:hypothetical protein SVAN01_01262 [Stagonosporopsis vannaccii]